MSDKVDIINLSWTFDNDAKNSLKDAIDEATRDKDSITGGPTNRALVFCAKSDQPYADDVFPANFPNAISVEAATSKARVGTEVSKPPDLLIWAERMPGFGFQSHHLDWTGNQPESHETTMEITGSSVATAIASGMASLMLTLAKLHESSELTEDRQWQLLKRRDVFLKVLEPFQQKNRLNDGARYLDPAKVFADRDLLVEGMNKAVREAS